MSHDRSVKRKEARRQKKAFKKLPEELKNKKADYENLVTDLEETATRVLVSIETINAVVATHMKMCSKDDRDLAIVKGILTNLRALKDELYELATDIKSKGKDFFDGEIALIYQIKNSDRLLNIDALNLDYYSTFISQVATKYVSDIPKEELDEILEGVKGTIGAS